MLAVAAAILLAGCGSNFEWFPKPGPFANRSTPVVPVPGMVMRQISFPTLPFPVKAVHDIAYDKITASFWMLAVFNGNSSNAPDALVQVKKNTVDSAAVTYVDRKDQVEWPVSISKRSTLAYDGSSFWITSGRSSQGGVASKVYKIVPFVVEAMYLGSFYNCPATSSGFCQGLAWDATTSSFWSAASDIAMLVNYQVLNGAVSSLVSYQDRWSGNGVTDVSFDNATNEVFVINQNGIIRVKANSGAFLGNIPFTVPGNGRGDWDGQYFWVIDNNAKKIKALFVR